jgi:hypothetical protein
MLNTLCSWWSYYKYFIMIFGSIIFLLIIYCVSRLGNSYYKKTAKRLKYVKKLYNDYGNNLFDISDDEIPGYWTQDKPSIKKRRLMPEVSKGEMQCKIYLERRFGKTFNKVRPDILKNSVTAHNLEIDLYNEELRLGIEYQGQQHYKYCPGIHRNMDHFRTQQYRDEMKRRLCKDNGITLIEVPYNIKDIDTYLENELIKNNFDIYFN